MEIKFENVVSVLGKTTILKGVSLSTQTGKITGIIGPNGSGKSTLIKTFFFLAPVNGGRILLDGENIINIKRRLIARRAAYVGQEMHCAFDFTVREIAAMGLSANRKTQEIVDEALETLHIEALANRNIQTLSGGEKKMAFLARAVAQDVDTIVLDEPANHLDIKHQLFILEFLKKSGKTILLVMHDLNLAARYCDTLYLLYRGEVAAAGSAETVLSPAHITKFFEVPGTVMRDETGRKSFVLL